LNHKKIIYYSPFQVKKINFVFHNSHIIDLIVDSEGKYVQVEVEIVKIDLIDLNHYENQFQWIVFWNFVVEEVVFFLFSECGDFR